MANNVLILCGVLVIFIQIFDTVSSGVVMLGKKRFDIKDGRQTFWRSVLTKYALEILALILVAIVFIRLR